MHLGQAQVCAARDLFAGLRSAGVTDVVLCPGSRSTPLVLGALSVEGLCCHSLIDERSAAFFALGQARVTGRPSVVVCTSGTAGAHFFPAVIEASAAYVPLIVVTADRPSELQNSGALQTIDQVKLYGNHVRAFQEVNLCDPGSARVLRQAGSQAVLGSMAPQPGAVHLNVHARKPLEPEKYSSDRSDCAFAPRVFRPRLLPSAEATSALAEALLAAARPLLVAGPASGTPAKSVLALALKLGMPIYAEATSQLRFLEAGDLEGVPLVDVLDPWLRAGSSLQPDLLVQLGQWPTSGGYNAFIEAHRGCPRVVIAPHGWQDPDHSMSMRVVADIEETAAAVGAALGARSHEIHEISSERRGWAHALQAHNERVWSHIRPLVQADALTEATLTDAVITAAPPGSILAVGNGLSLRHLDTFVRAGQKYLQVLSQRGASGIDGLVSSAAGAAFVAKRPVTLLLGDISLLHDIGGLWAARGVRTPLVVVVVHNDGGRIFEQLPIAQLSSSVTQSWFVKPHGLSFAESAAAYGLSYYGLDFECAVARAQLSSALNQAYQHPGCTLIQARVPPLGAVCMYQHIWQQVQHEG